MRVLSSDSLSKVKLPGSDEIKCHQDAIADKYPLLGDVYAVADGLKLYLEQSGDTVIQNMFYNGWTHDHYVSNVFVFSPSGLIVACAINAPGSMHDSQICDWGGIYDRLESMHKKSGGKVVVDSAFCRGSYPFLIKSAQDDRSVNSLEEVARLRQATSVRQAAEWGMRALQGSFPRLKDRFIYETNGERKVMLWVAVLLFNFRTRLVGLNQILSTYMPQMSAEANTYIASVTGQG